MVDQFQVKPLKGEDGHAVVSARLPKELIARLDQAAMQTNRNRNQLIAMALEYALDRLEIIEDADKEKEH